MENTKIIKKPVIVVGAGPAGLGIGIVLEKMGIEYLILERDSVGFSFKKWPLNMNLITPSFTGNYFNMVDLNSISPQTSPAFNLNTEHPTGIEYANYLEDVAHGYDLKISLGVDIKSIKKLKSGEYELESLEVRRELKII